MDRNEQRRGDGVSGQGSREKSTDPGRSRSLIVGKVHNLSRSVDIFLGDSFI